MPEDRSDTAAREAELDGEMIVWWVTRVACAAAFARLRREGRLSPEAEGRALDVVNGLAGSWHEIDPSDQVRSQAAILLRRHPLRVADALQLGAALKWAGPDPSGRGFVTFDARLAAAAALEGFTVIGSA